MGMGYTCDTHRPDNMERLVTKSCLFVLMLCVVTLQRATKSCKA